MTPRLRWKITYHRLRTFDRQGPIVSQFERYSRRTVYWPVLKIYRSCQRIMEEERISDHGLLITAMRENLRRNSES